MPIQVAITGGSGFLGKTILKQCRDRGWTVRAIGRTPRPELSNLSGVDFFSLDLSLVKNQEKLVNIFSGTDVVFHTAAKAGVWGRKQDFVSANITATKNVIAACKAAGVRNLVYTSTPSVVFCEKSISGGTEALPYYTGSLCHYAKTKAEAESLVRAAHSHDLRTVSLRPHLIWGPGDPHLIPRIIDQASQLKLRIIGDGKNKIDLTHVENAAHAHLLAAEKLLLNADVLCSDSAKHYGNGKAYFVSDGNPVILWKWINSFLEGIGVPTVTRNIPFKTAYRAGAFFEFFWKIFGIVGEPPITRFVATELSHNHWFDISAIRKDLGYEPIISNDDGFQKLLKFFR